MRSGSLLTAVLATAFMTGQVSVGHVIAQEAVEAIEPGAVAVPVDTLQEDVRAESYPTVQQWVVLDGNQQFRGRLVTPGWEGEAMPVVGATVMVTGADNVVHPADGVTNTIGEFVVSGLQPGVYTLFATGPKTVACKALHVLDASAAQPSNEALTISAAKISRERFLSAVSRYLIRSIGRSIPLSVDHAKRMSDEYVPGFGYRVVQSDGGLAGRVLGAGSTGAPMMNVLVYRGGSMVAKTTTDESGRFYVPDLPPASYGFAVMGPEGMAILGIELLREPSGLDLTQSGEQPVFVRAQVGAEIAIQLAPIAQDSPEIEELGPANDASAPTAPALGGGLTPPGTPPIPPVTGGGGIAGGGFSGSGSGGMGGGGRGGLGIIAAGGIAAAAIAAEDDDDTSLTPPPASPATP